MGALIAALLVCLAPLIHATCASVMAADSDHSMTTMHHHSMHIEGLTQWVAPVVMDSPHSAGSHMLGMSENAEQVFGIPVAAAIAGLVIFIWLQKVRPLRVSVWFRSLLDPPNFTPPAFASVDLTRLGVSRT